VPATLEQRIATLERILHADHRRLPVFVSASVLSGRLQTHKGADVASADEITLGTDGNYFDVTGTTTINHINNSGWQNGSVVILQFDASVTVTHNAGSPTGSEASILLSGERNFSATENDALTLVYDGTTFREVARATDGGTVTTAELNLIDGDTARGTTALASGDGILINDGGTMRMTNVDTVQTFMGGHYKTYTGTFTSTTTGDISISSIGFVPTAAICMYGMSNTGETDAEGNWSLGWAYKTGATSSSYGMSYNYFQQGGTDVFDFDQSASYIGRLAYGGAKFSMLTITAWAADALTLTKSVAGTPNSSTLEYQLLVQG